MDTGLSNRSIPLVILRDSCQVEALLPEAMGNAPSGRIHTVVWYLFRNKKWSYDKWALSMQCHLPSDREDAWENVVPEAVMSQDVQELKSSPPEKTGPSKRQTPNKCG